MAETKSALKVEISVDDKGSIKIKEFGKEVDKAGKGGKEAFDNADKSVKRFESSADSAVGMTKMLGSALAAIGIAKVAGDFLQTASNMETYQATLTTVLGSTEKAKGLMSWIKDFAASTPFEIPGLVEAATRLQSYGMDAQKYMRTLGDTASAMGKPLMSAVEAIADASQGEFERLKEFGLRSIDVAKAAGFASVQEMTATREGLMAGTEAIMGMFEQRYAGGMELQSKTWKGMVSNLLDWWTQFQQAVMDNGVFDFLKAGLSIVLDNVNALKSGGNLGTWAADMAEGVVAGMEGIIYGVSLAIDAFWGFQFVWEGLRGAFGVFMTLITTGYEKLLNGVAFLLEKLGKKDWAANFRAGAEMMTTANKFWNEEIKKSAKNIDELKKKESTYLKAEGLITKVRDRMKEFGEASKKSAKDAENSMNNTAKAAAGASTKSIAAAVKEKNQKEKLLKEFNSEFKKLKKSETQATEENLEEQDEIYIEAGDDRKQVEEWLSAEIIALREEETKAAEREAAKQKREAEKLAKAERQAAADRDGAYRDMYRDLGDRSDKYYEEHRALLEKQKQDYITLTQDKQLAETWFKNEQQKLFIEQGKNSGSMIDGMKAGWEDLQRTQTTWGEVGFQTVKTFSEEGGKAMGKFINPLDEDFGNVETAWDTMWGNMVTKITDAVGEIIFQWGRTKGMEFLGDLLGGFDISGAMGELGGYMADSLGLDFDFSDFDFGFRHDGDWDVNDFYSSLKPNEVPAVLEQGEMVIPKNVAGILREQLERAGINDFNAWSQSLQDNMVTFDPYVNPAATDFVENVIGNFASTMAMKGATMASAISTIEGLDYGDIVHALMNPETLGYALAGSIGTATVDLVSWGDEGFIAAALTKGFAFLGSKVGGPFGALLGRTAAVPILDAISDIGDFRSNESFKDALEAQFGYVNARDVYQSLGQLTPTQEVYANLMGMAYTTQSDLYNAGYISTPPDPMDLDSITSMAHTGLSGFLNDPTGIMTSPMFSGSLYQGDLLDTDAFFSDLSDFSNANTYTEQKSFFDQFVDFFTGDPGRYSGAPTIAERTGNLTGDSLSHPGDLGEPIFGGGSGGGGTPSPGDYGGWTDTDGGWLDGGDDDNDWGGGGGAGSDGPSSFHKGGPIGWGAKPLAFDERIITVQTGEGVLTREAMRAFDDFNRGIIPWQLSNDQIMSKQGFRELVVNVDFNIRIDGSETEETIASKIVSSIRTGSRDLVSEIRQIAKEAVA